MNERLKKIAEAAGMQECSLGYGMPENVLWGDREIEQFAQLIIDECMEKAYHMGRDSGPVTADLIRVRIDAFKQNIMR